MKPDFPALADTPPAGTPPIEDDRALARDVPAAPGEPRHRLGSPRRRRLIIGLAIVILLLIAVGLWGFTRTQWYVGEDQGRVALYHGVKSKPLGIPLSSVEQTYFPLTCLQPVDQSRIRSGYVADSQGDARRFIDTLRTLPSSADTQRVPPDARVPSAAPKAPAPSAATGGSVSAPQCAGAGGS